MDREIGKIGVEGLTFFGKTNRLISHELKNILAIISETMGLLDELVELSESGTRLTPEKLRSMSESILEEIDRANTVIRCMNRFAHSVDAFIDDVDLKAAISLAIRLVGLDPFSKTLKIELLECDSHAIQSSPFFLQNLLYHALYFALSAAAPDKHIRIALLADKNGAEIEIAGIAPSGFRSFPPGQVASLAKAVGVEIAGDRSSGKVRMVLPQKMTGSLAEAQPVKSLRE